jgi:polyisoprenyl-teichoic acid--peptidoglycan teichoic acid transferase
VPEQQLRGLRARLEGRGLDPDGAGVGETESREGFEEESDLLAELLEEHPSSDAGERPRRGLQRWWRRRSERRASRRAERDRPSPEESSSPDLLEELLESEGATPPAGEESREPGAEVVAAEESPGDGAQPSNRAEANETQDAAEMQATSVSQPDAAPESRRRRWFGRRRAAGSDAEPAPDLLEELLLEGRPTGEEAPPAGERLGGRGRGRHLARAQDGDDESPEGDDAAAGRRPVGRDSVLPVGGGPRRAARERRRTRIRRRVVAVVVLVAVGAAGVGVSRLLEGAEEPRPRSAAGAIVPAASDEVTTTLVFGTRQYSDGSPDSVIWMSLLSLDRGGEQGAVVYIPAHTATEVPGRGLLGLGESFAAGGIPLLLVSTETLLGVPVDHYLELSQEEAATLFKATGEISVDVPGEVRVPAGPGQARVLLEPGLQRLSAEHLVQLLFTIGIDGDDAELGGRHLAFWQGFFEEFSDDGDAIHAAVLAAGPALGGTDFEGQELAEFLIGLVDQPPSSRTLANLPVEEVSVGGDELYQVDQEQVDDFIEDAMGASGEAAEEVRVQILNGNGVPGIGQEVARRLVGHGFRVILSGNARNLDNQKTRIVSYDASPAGLAAAERAQDLLGLGEVQVSSQGQGIVDLTIVVGEDFPGKS